MRSGRIERAWIRKPTRLSASTHRITPGCLATSSGPVSGVQGRQFRGPGLLRNTKPLQIPLASSLRLSDLTGAGVQAEPRMLSRAVGRQANGAPQHFATGFNVASRPRRGALSDRINDAWQFSINPLQLVYPAGPLRGVELWRVV
jgi:hypothetical protein